MATAVLALAEEGDWHAAGDDAHRQAAAAFNVPQVSETWRELLTADLDPAVPARSSSCSDPADRPCVPAAATLGDWRRDYGEGMAKFLRGYVLDHGGASRMFAIVRRRAAERSLRTPQADAHTVWALATLAAMMSGDWLNGGG
jgi:hypothetical protein